MNFSYFEGKESEQFSFIRIPRVLFTDEYFSCLSIEAKLLYGILLDRMSLSRRNKWFDSENHVYIIYKIDEIHDDLGFSKRKAMDCLADLERIGLIRKKKRGQGNPSLLYVMNFLAPDKCSSSDDERDDTSSGNAESAPSEVQKSTPLELQKSVPLELQKSTPLELQKSTPLKNYTDKNQTDRDISIYPSLPGEPEQTDGRNGTVSVSSKADPVQREAYEEVILRNVNRDMFEKECATLEKHFEDGVISLQDYEYACMKYDTAMADRIIRYMLDILCSKSTGDIRIGEEFVSREAVKKRLLSVDHKALSDTVLELNMNPNIHNRKGYAISMLYNS